MNNQQEFTDNSKSVDPQVLKAVNTHSTSAGDLPVKDRFKNTKQQSDAETLEPEFSALDFTSVGGLVSNAKYFETVQDIADVVLNGMRVPYCDSRFTAYNVPKSNEGVPALNYDYFISDSELEGTGATTFGSWSYGDVVNLFDGYVKSDEKFEVKMDSKTASNLMTLASIWSNEYLDKGVRDSRARPSAVLGDWTWALPPTFSTKYRRIRTDLVANYMYSTWTAPTVSPLLFVVNASDLRDYMNVTGGATWPIPLTTPCLALSALDKNDISRLIVLGHTLYVDLDNSMNADRADAETKYFGVKAYSLTVPSSVPAQDTAARIALQRTFSAVDLQWAFLSLAMPMCSAYTGCWSGTNHFKAKIYTNTIPDQFINFYATHYEVDRIIPWQDGRDKQFIQSWRIFKTCLIQRALLDVGCIGQMWPEDTFGKYITDQNYFDLIAGDFRLRTWTIAGMGVTSHIAWIPFEMYIANGADMILDDEDLVVGSSGQVTNKNFLCPRSIAATDLNYWKNTAAATSTALYYIPNNLTGFSFWTRVNNTTHFDAAIPWTVPCYKSTSETATTNQGATALRHFKVYYTKQGLTNDYIYRKKMVFKSATKV